MLKLEAFRKQTKVERTPQQCLQNLQQRVITFKRESFTSEQDFLIQGDEHKEIIYLKPEANDSVMIELTQIGLSEMPEMEALEYHIRAHQLLEYFTHCQVQVQYTSVLFQKLNYALALKKCGIIDEVIQQLQDCDEILKIKGKQLKTLGMDQQIIARLIQNKLLRLRIIFQLTLLFSESRKNKQALELAKKALKQLRVIFSNTIKLCQLLNVSSFANKKHRANSEMNLMISQQVPINIKIPYSQVVENVFKEILNIIKGAMPTQVFEDKFDPYLIRAHQSRSQSMDKYTETFKVNNQAQNSKLYPTIQDSHPMLQMQILGLMQMTQVDLQELYPISNPEMVIAEEVVLELIMLAGLCFYSISTEMRFINSSYDNKINLEIWLCKSLEVYYTYVPHSSQIFNQIYQVYKKLYGVDKQSIPEDQEITYLTKLLRPSNFNNKATLANKVVIVIKIPDNQKQTIHTSTHANTQTNQLKTIQSKKHLLTQAEEESSRSPTRLFLKPTPQSLEVRQKATILMNQLIQQQQKTSKEKLKMLKNKLKPSLLCGNQLKSSTNINQNTQNLNSNQTTQISNNNTNTELKQLSRSLSNSRKNSQYVIPLTIQQALQQTRTAQLKYRYKAQLSGVDESPTLFSSTRNNKFPSHKYQLILQQKLQNVN